MINLGLSPQYVAGLFDGEGCVIIQHEHRGGRPTYRLRAVLANNHPVLKLVKEYYGGYLQEKSNGFLHLTWDSTQATEFLFRIHPWSIIKLPQIQLALSFSKLIQRGNNQPLTDEEIEERSWFKQEVSRINQLGGRPDIA